jgi:HD-like signal output (HDOD) protein
MPIKSTKISLNALLELVDRLPQPPQVALKLARLLEDASASAEQLAQVIQLDANMTGQVLRLCNSSAYGLSRRIETIKEAIALLGFGTLKSLVYTIISQNTLDKPLGGYDLAKGMLWHNAAACAMYAKHLAVRFGGCDPELAYTGSVLRDVGKLVLSQFVGDAFLTIEQYAIEKQIDFDRAETQVLGFSHTELGQKVAEKWDLSPTLQAVIRYHHEPSSMPEDTPADLLRVTALIHLADTFTMMMGCGLGGDGMMYSLDEPGLKRAGIPSDESAFEQIYGELIVVNEQVKSLIDSFGAV